MTSFVWSFCFVKFSARIRKMCDLLDSKGDILKVNTGKGVADHVCVIPGKEDCEI